MRLLLDSHVLLWAVFEPQKLSALAREAIGDTNNMVSFSIASLWEIAIKKNIGKLAIPDSFFDEICGGGGFEIIPVRPNHIKSYLELPLHHRNPFDRMLVAQAKTEQLSLVTSDDVIMKYDVSVLK